MGTDASVALVERWFQAYNDGDMQAEAAMRSEDFVAHVSGVPQPLNNDGWTQFIAGFYGAFPDAKLLVEDMAGGDGLVAVRWRFEGTHQGVFMGIPPTGKSVAIGAMEFNRVVGDKVVEHWVQLDQLSLLQALGAIPSPG
jgi:steroid delta-isomerase-like uncharacterized protein